MFNYNLFLFYHSLVSIVQKMCENMFENRWTLVTIAYQVLYHRSYRWWFWIALIWTTIKIPIRQRNKWTTKLTNGNYKNSVQSTQSCFFDILKKQTHRVVKAPWVSSWLTWWISRVLGAPLRLCWTAGNIQETDRKVEWCLRCLSQNIHDQSWIIHAWKCWQNWVVYIYRI